MSEEGSTDNHGGSIGFDGDDEDGLSTIEWLDLDVDLYVASQGNTIGNDEYQLKFPGEDYQGGAEKDSSDSVAAKGIEEDDKGGGSKRSNSRSQGGKNKRAKLISLAASERVYNFPAKMVTSLNVGNMKQLGELIEEYCVPDVSLKTKLMGEGVKGRAALTHFLATIYSSCPDMVMLISSIKLNRDFSIVFKGGFEGTYIDGRNATSASHKAIIDTRDVKEIVGEARDTDKDKFTAAEKSQLEGINKSVTADPDTVIRTQASYACRILFLSPKTGAAPNAPAHQLITELEFDWKTTVIEQPNYDE